MFVYLIILFYLVVLSPFPSCSVFFFRCVLHSLSLPMSSCLGCIPLLIRLAFLRSLVTTRMFFLPYAYYVVVFCLFFCFCFCLSFCFLFIYFYFTSPLCPFLAMMSFAGYFLVRFILSTFFLGFLHLTCLWFDLVDSAYLMTTAGFVADQLM